MGKSALLNQLWPFVRNPYGNHGIGLLAGRTLFRRLNRWPGATLPWTDKRVAVCISFDCDTELDGPAFDELIPLLSRYGVRSSFAVIGALLKMQPEAYAKVVAAGHEVLSHGYSRHSGVDAVGHFYSTMYYNELSWERIEEEIVRNQSIVRDILGVTPIGFRTPHFGTFQSFDQLSRLRSILARHGFAYSTSSLMFHAQRFGWEVEGESVLELPVSNLVGPPVSLWDSYSLLHKRSRIYRPGDFFPLFQKMIDTALTASHPILVNVYVDPCHVAALPAFEECLKYLQVHRDKIWVGTYEEIVRSIGHFRPHSQSNPERGCQV